MFVKPSDWTIKYFLANQSNCNRVLEDSDALQKIPSLNSASLDHFKDGQLVRFQGMLQDTYDPEYYFKNFEVVNKNTGESSIRCGMYTDGAQCEANERVFLESDKNESSERQTWIVISTPGLNDWAKDESTTNLNPNLKTVEKIINDSSKRSLDKNEEAMDCSEPVPKKGKVFIETADDAGPSQLMKEESKTSLIISKDHILNFPIPNENGKACMVKIYCDISFKLNQIIDVIGFLSLDPNLSEIHDSEEMKDDLEIQTHHPPASIVPRLHAIKVSGEQNKNIDETSLLAKAQNVRGDLKIVLTQLLLGDEIAADYLICHLISSIYLRKDCLSLGAFPLNITNIPKTCSNFTKDFYKILEMIVLKSHYLDITLENLNEMNLLPKKDYDCNRLTSGILQLSKNTHLILDETHLSTGEVTSCGRKNYSTISDLIQFQRIAYDFKFYTMEYETDIPVLILSETKSFIPCQNQVAIKPEPETVKIYPQVLEAAKQYLKDNTKLNNIREYVNMLKNVKFEFSEDTSNIIQEDFVSLRQMDKNFSANDLHSLMVLSRLMSLSHGFNSLSPEMWKRSLQMEMERKSRLLKRN